MSDVTIKIKRSLTPGNVPADLELGELAINIPDKKIYIGDNSTDNIALIVDGNATGGSGTPDSVLSTALESILVAGENITITPTTDNTITISTASAQTLWSNSNATTATDINGIPAGTTGLVGDNAIEILERILYPFQVATIPSFTMSGPDTTYEIGATAATPLFSWSLTNTSNISALTFTYQRVTDGGLPNGTTSPSIANATNYNPSIGSLTTSTIGAGMNFFLTATQSNPLYAAAVSTTRSIRWWSRMYWGRSSSTAETTYANLTNSSNTLLTSSGSFTQSVSFGSSSGTYLYIYFHSSRTLSSIVLNTNNSVVTDSFTQLTNQTITNSNGVSVTYKVYRSVETLAGSDTYTVNLT
jgi:hypothetical protein